MSKYRSLTWVFIAAYGMSVFAAAQHGRFNALPDAIMQSYSLSPSGFGWLVSLTNLAPALFAGVAGYAVWAFGLRRSLILGACLQAALALATTLTRSDVAAFALRSLEGLPYLIVVVAAPTIIASASAGTLQSRLLAFWATYFFIGVSLVTLLGAWDLEQIGWRYSFVLLSSCTAVFALLAGQHLGETDFSKGLVITGRARLSRKVWYLCLSFFGIAFLAVSLPSVVPLFLSDRLGLSRTEAGTVVAMATFASAGGSLLYGVFSSAISARLAGIFCVFAAALPMAVLFSYEQVERLAAQLLCLASFVALGSLAAIAIAAVPRLAPDVLGVTVANGLLTQLGSLGALLGPPAYLCLFESFGWHAIARLIIAAALATSVLLHLALRTDDVLKEDLSCQN